MSILRRKGSGSRNGPLDEIDWTAAFNWYVDRNITRGPGEPAISYQDVANEFGMSHDRVKHRAAAGEWRAELAKRRRQIEIEATREVQQRYIETEAQVRLGQAHQADRVMDWAMTGMERELDDLASNPEARGMPKDLIRAFFYAAEQKRKALGLNPVVEIKDQTGEDSVLNRLARLHDRQEAAGEFQAILDEVAQEHALERAGLDEDEDA